MSEAVPSSDQSLDQILGREDQEIAALLKKAGVEDPDLISADGEAETVPPPKQSETDLHAEAPEPEKEPEEKPPAKEPEPEPQEEEKEPAEPEPPKQEARRERIPTWKVLRDADRRMKQLEEENRLLKQQPPPAQPQYQPEEVAIQELDNQDPLTKIEQRLSQTEGELKAQAEINRQNALRQQITNEENYFKQTHPDYDQAVNFIAQRARNRFSATGELEEQTQTVVSQHRQKIEDILAHQGVANPNDDQFFQVAENIAFAVLFERERQSFVNRQLSRGRNVAQAAFELAESEGYSPKVATPETAPPSPTPSQSKAKEPSEAQKRVQRQAEIAKANQSLSAMQNSGPARSTTVKSKTEFMRMTPEQQDKYVEIMEDVDPDWVQKLPD